jgi:phosphomevalonate kinase
MPSAATCEFAAAAPSGVALVDLVRAERGAVPAGAWRATVDSAAFFAGTAKLGLGSSAAALCAWSGAWHTYTAAGGAAPAVADLIALHRRFQGGRGSGLDVAASMHGGVIEFRLGAGAVPHIGSVRLPNSVGFAGIFAGRSASTPQLVGRYRAFCAARPAAAAGFQRRLESIAEDGCAAARGDDAGAFIAAINRYGRALGDLGIAIDGEIVTAEHRRIGEQAQRFGVAYKVSGAGGGDLGLAFAANPEALAAFKQSMNDNNFPVVDFRVAPCGMSVEERNE